MELFVRALICLMRFLIQTYEIWKKKKDIDGLIKALNHDEYLIRKEAAKSLKKVVMKGLQRL